MSAPATPAADASLDTARLLEPHRYPHAVDQVEMIETHISWVFLAGAYAYKIKKPVKLGFLDFETLEDRRHYCEEELRLNRRNAPDLYLDVVRVTGSAANPRFCGAGPAIEYAVRMRRFAQEALADDIVRRGAFYALHADSIAEAVSALHASAPVATASSEFGSAEHICAQALENFEALAPLLKTDHDRRALEDLRLWTLERNTRLAAAFVERKRSGFVRECHGDLHLRNIVFLEGRPVPFDCIEFDPFLRWIDVMSEVAFLMMDLLEHGLRGLAWRLLNAYLEHTGDYGGVVVLRYYLVYRAMVRAKVERLRSTQQPVLANGGWRAYFSLARRIAAAERPAIVLMHGVSGSGKTTVSQALVERLGAVRVRSDVERKRMHGVPPLARTGSAPDADLYAAAKTTELYARLRQLARAIVQSGHTAVVDAAFLARWERDSFRQLADWLEAPFFIACCEALPEELRRRVQARELAGRDASEAGVAVLEAQIAAYVPLGEDELGRMETFHTGGPGSLQDAIDRLAGRLERAAGSAHAVH